MKNICVLVSGSGTNLQRIIDAIGNGEIHNAKIALVVADRECFGLQRAENHGIENIVIRRGKDFSVNLKNSLSENIDLIVLAGFLSILSKDFCKDFNGKIINIHPALLPKFGGKGMWGHHVHDAVLKAKEKVSGATVHYVTPGIDEGEIILQKSFAVTDDETIKTLAQKVQIIEHEIFPKAINRILNNNSNKVAFITDLHMLEKNVAKKGVDTVQNWKPVLQDLKARGISRIILGGDLGEKEALESIFRDIEDLQFEIILGNHDKIRDFDKFYSQAQGKDELYYTSKISDADCIFLDTSSYKLNKEQQKYLKDWLTTAHNPVVFIHHPILGSDSWMNKEHPLKNKEKVKEIIAQSGKNTTIISGHYHHHYEQTADNIRQIISPAVSYQILNSKTYQADTKTFGYLILHFSTENIQIEKVSFSV